MKMKGAWLLLSSLMFSYQALASNDVYGSVSEMITRSGGDGDTLLYFRLNVDTASSQFEDCVVDSGSLVWEVDLSSPVADIQYDILKRSYIEQRSVRVIGYDDVCANGQAYSDKIFELSPQS